MLRSPLSYFLRGHLSLLEPCDQSGLGGAKPPTKRHVHRPPSTQLIYYKLRLLYNEQYDTRYSVLSGFYNKVQEALTLKWMRLLQNMTWSCLEQVKLPPLWCPEWREADCSSGLTECVLSGYLRGFAHQLELRLIVSEG